MAGEFAVFFRLPLGVVHDKRDVVLLAHAVAADGFVAGVVGHKDVDGVVVPRLLGGVLHKLGNRPIAVLQGVEKAVFACFGMGAGVEFFAAAGVGFVRGAAEKEGEKRFGLAADLLAEIHQAVVVPAERRRVLRIGADDGHVFLAVIFLKADGFGDAVDVERAAVGGLQHQRAVALLLRQLGDAAHVVQFQPEADGFAVGQGGHGSETGLDADDAALPCGVKICPHLAFGDQRVHIGCGAVVFA